MYGNNLSFATDNNLDVLFVIDSTISMQASDYPNNETRLDMIKRNCRFLIDELNGARFSIIAFNNTSRTIIPYTKDTNILDQMLDIIQPIDELSAKGSSLNTPFENIMTSLQNASKKDRTRIIFFMSDGEITNESSLISYKEAKKYVNNGVILGYGTTNGSTMMVYNKYSNTNEYIMDHGEKAITRLDENNLKKLANDMGIDYLKVENQDSIKQKLGGIKQLQKDSSFKSNKKSYNDTYYLFQIPLLVLLYIKYKKIKGSMI